ncbi:MAG TPA: hypothetical protein VEH84_18285 [Alphaproteobacteria bacterium]|nr:hypothetical protein [Alphaproteobacteria bacterium]
MPSAPLIRLEAEGPDGLGLPLGTAPIPEAPPVAAAPLPAPEPEPEPLPPADEPAPEPVPLTSEPAAETVADAPPAGPAAAPASPWPWAAGGLFALALLGGLHVQGWRHQDAALERTAAETAALRAELAARDVREAARQEALAGLLEGQAQALLRLEARLADQAMAVQTVQAAGHAALAAQEGAAGRLMALEAGLAALPAALARAEARLAAVEAGLAAVEPALSREAAALREEIADVSGAVAAAARALQGDALPVEVRPRDEAPAEAPPAATTQ